MLQIPKQYGFRLTIAFIVAALLIISYYQFSAINNPDDQKGEVNLVNIQKIQQGMDTSAVVSIMGKPESRYLMKGSSSFYYPGTASSGLDCHIIFDENSKVIRYFPTAEEMKKFKK